MQSFMKYFGAASMLTLLVVLGSLVFGGVATATVVCILGVLEVSNSVDNAVANAVKLKTLSPAAQHWFMFFGILIAVFGMRLLIPALIVCITGGLSFTGTFALAMHDPKQYGVILEQAHPILAAFGGSFLFMIFANFFIDPDKESHWLPALEVPLSRLAFWEGIKITFAVALVAGFDWSLYHSYSSTQAIHFFVAGLIGIFSNVAVEMLGNLVEKFGDKGDSAKASSAEGLSLKMAIPALMYLEVLDASMSFDGVMGAFALTSDIFIIMAGLGIGAFWVRSLTLMAVEKGTLAEFRYLENGAFWAIGILSLTLFISTEASLPDWFVALISAGVIIASVVSSIRSNRIEAAAAA